MKTRSTYFAEHSCFSFLLLASRQICNMAMGITGKVIELFTDTARIEPRHTRPKYVQYRFGRKMADSDWCRVYLDFPVY